MNKSIEKYAKILTELDDRFSIREWDKEIVKEIKTFITNKMKEEVIKEEGFRNE